MIILIIFAFIAGLVTILSPCILPILPIILSSSVGGTYSGKARPLGIATGFIFSFTFFTLFLSSLVKALGIPADALRVLSVIIIGAFGLSLLLPNFQALIEKLFSKLSSGIKIDTTKKGFGGGFIIGLSIGLIWTPCVGPILASVIALALTGTVTLQAVLITFAYSIGTAVPLFLIILGGQNVIKKIPALTANLANIQKAFGVLMIVTAVGIYFNFDRKVQTAILTAFPNYGLGLTKIEDRKVVTDQLVNMGAHNKAPNAKSGESSSLYLPKLYMAPEIIPGGQWFNTAPMKLSELKGKVVLIDFWTYTCINCQRTLPYLRSWHEKYSDKGLVIIGIHSPEFEFEKSADNLQEAINDFELKYPIVQDNDFSTWRAYSNRYWPAKYFIDKEGFVRYYHFGEGKYDESEKVIQELLIEAGTLESNSEIYNPTYDNNAQTPELYLGYFRLKNFESPENILRDELQTYTAPQKISSNNLAYSGEWIVTGEYANPQKGATLFLNFSASKVFLVMRPKEETGSVKVFLDNKLENTITVDSDSLYDLIKLESPGRHMLKLEFLDSNLEVFAFTFG